MLQRICCAVILVVLFAIPAQAALLTEVNGVVFVNTGQGFKPVTGPTEVKPGDRIMVGKNGAAKIAYGLNCTTSLTQNQNVVVSNEVPCSANGAQPGADTTSLVVGGVIIAAGVAGGIALTRSNDKKKPASP